MEGGVTGSQSVPLVSVGTVASSLTCLFICDLLSISRGSTKSGQGRLGPLSKCKKGVKDDFLYVDARPDSSKIQVACAETISILLDQQAEVQIPSIATIKKTSNAVLWELFGHEESLQVFSNPPSSTPLRFVETWKAPQEILL